MLLLLHAAATLFLVGLIWTIQIVHYPLFGQVGKEGYTAYQLSHQRRISIIVIPPMLLELATAILLFLESPDSTILRIGLALLAVIWISTALLQAPIHTQLARSWSPTLHRRLVLTNWLRTIAWTIRGGLALSLLHHF